MVAILQPLKSARPIPIDRAVILVGRSGNCDVVITGSRRISRRHCCLVQSDDRFYIRDLGSTNGVWVNGRRVDSVARISAGDLVAIGDVEFRFLPDGAVRDLPESGARELSQPDLPVADGARPDTAAAARSPAFQEDDRNDDDIISDEEIDIITEDDAHRIRTPVEGPDVSEELIESEPVINLDDSFSDDDIEDIITFDDP